MSSRRETLGVADEQAFGFLGGARGKHVQQSDNCSDPFDSKAVVTFLTLVGLALCGFLLAASLYGLFQGLPIWSSYDLAIASVFRVS
jgi:hypothetical protein